MNLPQDIVFAAKILVDVILATGLFGNISVRIPNSKNFFINPANIIFENLKPEDIVAVDADGKALNPNQIPHPGTCIHQAIYQLRPDVHAIVHTHSASSVYHSLLGSYIEPFDQMGAALVDDQGIYQGFTGSVRSVHEGLAIAKSLQEKSIVIAKNHGLFATGPNLPSALWDMIVADQACKTHLEAKRLGISAPPQLPPEYLQKCKREVRAAQYPHIWQNYQKKFAEGDGFQI